MNITKAIVDADGGQIKVESEHENGSRFEVWLHKPVPLENNS